MRRDFKKGTLNDFLTFLSGLNEEKDGHTVILLSQPNVQADSRLYGAMMVHPATRHAPGADYFRSIKTRCVAYAKDYVGVLPTDSDKDISNKAFKRMKQDLVLNTNPPYVNNVTVWLHDGEE